MRRRGLLCALVVTALVAGCSGDDAGSLERSELPQLVVQPGDLPSVFEEFDRGAQGRADAFLGRAVDPGRFGRVDGWKARYRRPGGQRAPGPLVVESKLDLFESAEGAKRELDRIATVIRETFGGAEIDNSTRLGDETLAATFGRQAGGFATQFVVLVWRAENVTAALIVTGVRGLAVSDAVALGRKQQQRIDRLAAD